MESHLAWLSWTLTIVSRSRCGLSDVALHHHFLAALLVAGYQHHEYHNYIKSRREQKANFLLGRLQDAGFVTCHCEDGQNNNFFSSGESVWSPRGASLRSGDPPALYFCHPSHWARFKLFNKRDPICWNGESSNKVSSVILTNHFLVSNKNTMFKKCTPQQRLNPWNSTRVTSP